MVISFPKISKPKTPPLEAGDRLSGSKFRQRYAQMSENQRSGQTAELIESKVHFSSNLRFESYSDCRSNIFNWLGIYAAATQGTSLHSEVLLCLDADNLLMPDAILRLDESAGGRSRLVPSNEIEGTPELIVEIAASRATICLREKLQAYRRNGVSEYIVWQVFDERIDWFNLQLDSYVNAVPDQEGILQSQLFSGLWLDSKALIDGNVTRTAEVRQAGLESGQHKAFVNQLKLK